MGAALYKSAIGATVWSADRVLLGEIIEAQAAPGGQLDARIRLGATLGIDDTALIRLNPKAIRNGRLNIKMKSGQFVERITN
ncbi:hypothetical protein PM01_03475 [Sulfitobacter pontiacus 3SOLIMAR09]|nr:hypothetical protein PM01_03475 [Sulfitobacter pontiacus 3SOLIMAR09]